MPEVAERTCVACGKTLPETGEFFDRGYGEGAKYLSRRCKPCESRRILDDEKFWSRHRHTPDEYHDDDWGGPELRFGNILDDWPEFFDDDPPS